MVTIYSSPLLATVQKLILARDMPISADDPLALQVGRTGRWLRLFVNGNIENPSAATIEQLFEILTGEPLIKPNAE